MCTLFCSNTSKSPVWFCETLEIDVLKKLNSKLKIGKFGRLQPISQYNIAAWYMHDLVFNTADPSIAENIGY